MERLYFTGYKKTEDIYKDIAEAVDTRLDTLNYELDRTLPKETNKKVIELMKYELGGKIMTIFFGLWPKIHSYLIDDGSEVKEVKGTKTYVIKGKIKFENYQNC